MKQPGWIRPRARLSPLLVVLLCAACAVPAFVLDAASFLRVEEARFQELCASTACADRRTTAIQDRNACARFLWVEADADARAYVPGPVPLAMLALAALAIGLTLYFRPPRPAALSAAGERTFLRAVGLVAVIFAAAAALWLSAVLPQHAHLAGRRDQYQSELGRLRASGDTFLPDQLDGLAGPHGALVEVRERHRRRWEELLSAFIEETSPDLVEELTCHEAAVRSRPAAPALTEQLGSHLSRPQSAAVLGALRLLDRSDLERAESEDLLTLLGVLTDPTKAAVERGTAVRGLWRHHAGLTEELELQRVFGEEIRASICHQNFQYVLDHGPPAPDCERNWKHYARALLPPPTASLCFDGSQTRVLPLIPEETRRAVRRSFDSRCRPPPTGDTTDAQ